MTTHRNLKPHYAEPKGKSGPVIVVNAAREHQPGVCGARRTTSPAGFAACCHLPAGHDDVMHSDGWQSWFDRRDTSGRSSL